MLKYWLPLCGDLHNQGLDEVVVTNNGATANDNGKIGKCYYFDGNAHWLQLDRPLGDFYNNDFSLAVWLKPTDSTRSVIFSEYSASGASGVAIELTTERVIRVYWNNAPDIKATAAGGLALNEWSHIVIVKTDGEIKFYINGILGYTYTGTFANRTSNANPRIGDDYRGGTGVSYQGYMNDFRLYSHALSPKEVKELSKGLVLHYPLNRGGFGGDNLFTGSKDFSGTWVNSGAWTTSTEKYKGFTVKERSATWSGITQNIPCSNGDIFTISFYAKVESGGRISSTHRSSLGNVTTGLTLLDGNFVSGVYWINTTDDGTQWRRYWGTVRIDSSDITYLQWRIENSISGKKLSICGMKIEKGSIATPWVPNSADALFSSMGLDSNIEYDVSGYQNNGSIIGALICSSDTPRYMVSTYFNGGDNAITVPFNSVISDATIPFTINLWFKKSELGTDSYESLFGGPSGFEMDTRSGNATSLSLYMSSTRGGAVYSPFNLNEWYMVTMASDRTNEYYYVNGELSKTITAKSMPVGNYFIGAWQVYNKQNYKGLISDFRIYSTCLSADDILDLYHTPASIANNGTLLTQGEIAEV